MEQSLDKCLSKPPFRHNVTSPIVAPLFISNKTKLEHSKGPSFPHIPLVKEIHYCTGSTLVSTVILSAFQIHAHSNICVYTSHTRRAGGRAAGALNLSHWPRQLTGGVCEADVSAGIVCDREVA